MFVFLLQCISISGLGFQRGSYVCVCQDGFYFPDIHNDNKTFSGNILESIFTTVDQSDSPKLSMQYRWVKLIIHFPVYYYYNSLT